MAYKFKFKKTLGSGDKKVLGNKPFFGASTFKNRFLGSIALMTKAEKILAATLFAIAILLIGISAKRLYIDATKPAPAFGGTYREGILGEIKYINPILAASDSDKAISALIFSGLVKFDNQNQILPDLAKDWNVSSDQKVYTFNLRDDVYFHDGNKVTAQDVVYTISRMKELGDKSPLASAWNDVLVSAPNESQVVFELQKPFGPFIYNCSFGILPAHITPEDFAKNPIGSGKMKFKEIEKKQKESISAVNLVRNENYYGTRPYISKAAIIVYSSADEIKNDLKQGKLDAGVFANKVDGENNVSFSETKKMGLIFNVKNEQLKDLSLRQRILSDGISPESISLTLDTINAEPQKSRANEIQADFAKRNIKLDVRLHSAVEMVDVLGSRKYQLLLYGYDFGRDPDPYLFWHSSQIGKLNYANWSSKDTDIVLEDARIIPDQAQRQAKYDEFNKLIANQYVVRYYDVNPYYLALSGRIMGMEDKFGPDQASRYNNFEKWYINEKRVRK